jgi:hypothetical protein
VIETRKHIKVFLGSPGDLGDERKTAKAVVDEYNALLASALGYQIELVGWEDTVSVYGRPQATINRELERCQLFVGMMWKHWGTPPDNGGPYTSGFEEEFRESVARRKRDGTPEISMFFKNIDSDFTRDPGPALSKVLAFRKELIEGKSILFEEFSEPLDFEKKLRRCLTSYVFRLRDEDQERATGLTQPVEAVPRQPVSTPQDGPLTLEGAKFLRSFVTNHEGHSEASVAAPDVARIRLLTQVVRATGNDSEPLGAHDLNLLYDAKSHYDYSRRETSQLLSDGLERLSNENVPVWHWCSFTETARNDLIAFTLYGRTQRRIGAFQALDRLGIADIKLGDLGRENFVLSWLSEETPAPVRQEALKYLGNWGISSDIDAITLEIERKDSQTQPAAIDAVVRIRLRTSRDDAVCALNELQPSRVSRTILSDIFQITDTVMTGTLIESLKHQNADVRRAAAQTLYSRGELSAEIASILLSDSDPDIRYVALRTLVANGQHFTDDKAKSILMPLTKGPNALIPLPDQKGKSAWEEFRRDRLRHVPIRELEDSVQLLSIYDQEPYFVLASRAPKRFGARIRASLADYFKVEFNEECNKVSQIPGGTETLLKQTQDLEEFTRKRLTRRALDFVTAQSDRRDLSLVREILQSKFIEWNKLDMAYFAKFGGWEDADLIISGCDNWNYVNILDLSPDHSARFELTAKALHAVGRSHPHELLQVTTPARLKVNIIRLSKDAAFKNISDELFDALTHDDEETVRKAAVLKAARSFPKGRLSSFLTRYMDKDKHRYYNVIHWADMALSVSRSLLNGAVDRSLLSMS